MDFFSYTTMRDWARRCAQDRYPDDLDGFYREVFVDAARMHSGQLLGQGKNERDWERLRKPYQYRSPGVHNPGSLDVWSVGPDGKEIGNWK